MLDGIPGEATSWNQIRMTIVVAVYNQGAAKRWDIGLHELSNHAAEVGWHQQRFQTGQSLIVELSVEKAQEVHEAFHGLPHMADLQAIRKVRRSVESRWSYRLGSTSELL